MSLLRAAIAAAFFQAIAGGAVALPVPGQGTWTTTLEARDLDGNTATVEAFYDTVLKITWLRNADVLNGSTSWANANQLVDGLSIGGLTGWRLPTMVDSGVPGCEVFNRSGGTDCGANVQTKSGDVVFSEMAHLFYETLGNKSPYFPGEQYEISSDLWGLKNTGDFESLSGVGYWTGLESTPSSWFFDMHNGSQNLAGQNVPFRAMAVRDGDVAAVPEPETYALMLVGLGVVGFMARRRKLASVK